VVVEIGRKGLSTGARKRTNGSTSRPILRNVRRGRNEFKGLRKAQHIAGKGFKLLPLKEEEKDPF